MSSQESMGIVKELVIQNMDGKAMVSSLVVAEKFKKQHKNVLREIENLDLVDDFRQLNFEPANYLDKQNKPRPMFYMSRDGFMMLIMGFTGKKAMRLKQDYIKAFNLMEEYIRSHLVPTEPTLLEWGFARLEGKRHRLSLTEAIKYYLIPAAIKQGSQNSDKLYVSYSKMLNKEFIDDPDFEMPKGFNRRNYLNAWDLTFLGELEKGLSKMLVEEVNKGTNYKEIYKKAKGKVTEFADFCGKRTIVLPEKGPVPTLPRHKDECIQGKTEDS